MTRPYRRLQRAPLASMCVLLGSGLLNGCGPELNAIETTVRGALTTVAETIDPQPPRVAMREPGAAARPARPKSRPQPSAQANVTSEPGRCHDVQSCENLLRSLTENPDRSWITRTETPEALLTSVRMFAFRTLRPKLSCPELGAALEQMRGVPAALRPPPPRSSPEDVARANRLAAEVADDLRAEQEARCRAAAAPPPPKPAAPAPAQPAPPSQPPAATQPPSQPPASAPPTITTQPPAAPSGPPQVTIPDVPEKKQ
jgi:hypothetical protein